MNSKEIREKYIEFIKKEGHGIVPSTSLVPENDPSVLFVTAGVQPLVQYVLGEEHPKGDKIANVQKCVRTQDIDEVGDATHDTFFEMLGYWSFGDYFKERSINQLYDFFVKELGLDANKIYVTCFEGDSDAPKDTEAAEIWKSLGIPEHRIYFLGKDSNWWAPGENGPCGPDTEVFYDISGGNLDLKSKEEFLKVDDEQKIVEIANSVFMQYEKKEGVVVGELSSKNVDMGSGFERVVMAVQGKDNIFDTDLFSDLITESEKLTENKTSQRIISDHLRTAIMMISDQVLPSNTEQGYILRRLLRRSVMHTENNEISDEVIENFVNIVSEKYSGVYLNVEGKKEEIIKTISDEFKKFKETLEKGLKEFEKVSKNNISGYDAFVLFTTYGFPYELTTELAEQKGMSVNKEEYEKELAQHKELSSTSSAGKFKGGLAGDSEIEKRYHTATHLLNSALKQVLGDHISQKGSNINTERMRFDFSHGEKITDEEKESVTELVNEWIKEGLEVTRDEMSYDDAKNSGAIGIFEDKYGDTVSVYSIKKNDGTVVSAELCGGPHVKNTSEIGEFKIKKEEASSAGVRRIKAVLN